MIRRVVSLLIALTIVAPSNGLAGKDSHGGRVHVRAYTRKDGTYVREHTRSAPRGRSGYSTSAFPEPDYQFPQAPGIYPNPFVQQRREPRQQVSRNATPSEPADAAADQAQVNARRVLESLEKEDARCSMQESMLQQLVYGNQHAFTDSDWAMARALRDTFNSLRNQRAELRRDAEAAASGKVESTSTRQMLERVQLYVATLNKQTAYATSWGERLTERARHATPENHPAKYPAQQPTPAIRDVRTGRVEDALAAPSVQEQQQQQQQQRQAEFDTATTALHSLFTTLVTAAKAHTITKEEFANGVLNVALQQIELNKQIEAYNRQHLSHAVVIESRHTWYENVDHIVSEVIPRQ